MLDQHLRKQQGSWPGLTICCTPVDHGALLADWTTAELCLLPGLPEAAREGDSAASVLLGDITSAACPDQNETHISLWATPGSKLAFPMMVWSTCSS